MSTMFAHKLQKYAEVVVKVGLNLQPGQRLLIAAPLEAVTLVRLLTACAYQAGARFVDVIWDDEQSQLVRFAHAPRDSFAEHPTWQATVMLDYIEHGDALLFIGAPTPGLLAEQDQELVALVQKTRARAMQPAREQLQRNATTWCGISAATPGWAAKVFPDAPVAEQESKLWEAIFAACRVDRSDPVAAWQSHITELAQRRSYLNRMQYTALHFTGPGTDLTVGLAQNHLWIGVGTTNQLGIANAPNIPSEESFTLPHREKTDGIVRSSCPLNYGGVVIDDFSLTFAQGRVVQVTATQGEAILRKLLASDEGASHLGEVALVPHSSPIAQAGLLFHHTLFDENAASHIALGSALSFTLTDGEAMTAAEFLAAGGNQSMIHVDFMIGSAAMDVDGVTDTGASEPLMRKGEWAFAV